MTISGFQTFLVVSLSALIGLSACSHTPEGVLTEKQMRDVMIDLYTAEAMIYDEPQRYETFEQRRALFNDVFAKHHLTEAQYDSSLMWYGRNLDLYMGVCDMALEEVDRRLKSAGSEVSSDVTVRRSSSPATPDLWSGKRYYAFSPSDLSDRVVFETSPGGGAHATAAEYVLEMQIWGLQPAANEQIVVSLRADVENDSTLIQRDTITADGPHRVALINPPGNYVRRIYGYLRVIAPSSKVYVDSLRLTPGESVSVDQLEPPLPPLE